MLKLRSFGRLRMTTLLKTLGVKVEVVEGITSEILRFAQSNNVF
jgi:hypothetical protein